MHADIAFIGAGLANLSLLYRMQSIKTFQSKKIVVIEPDAKNSNDRTWCYWAKNEPLFSDLSQYRWNDMAFREKSKEEIQAIEPYSYYHLNSKDFYTKVIESIQFNLNIEWITSEVTEVDLNKDLNILHLSGERTIKAPLVFNNSLKHSGNQISKNGLKQHFYGLKIRLKDGKLPFKSVKLMDFSLDETDNVTQFGYILPFNEQEALIEYTEFSNELRSKKEYQELLKKYISQFDLKDFSITDEEMGVIPMSDLAFKDRRTDHFINTGMAGGLTKPTTGYTFQFVQKDSELILRALINDTKIPERKRKRRIRFYDQLLLKIIDQEPKQVSRIMSCLFSRNQFKSILKFLDEETNLLEEIRIFMSLPWMPFLKRLV